VFSRKSLQTEQEEVVMAFDPEEARQYLQGVDYPADKEEIVNTAESNDAPEELLDMLATMGRPEFTEEEDVVAELRASPGAG
jgi:hypothetical protein